MNKTVSDDEGEWLVVGDLRPEFNLKGKLFSGVPEIPRTHVHCGPVGGSMHADDIPENDTLVCFVCFIPVRVMTKFRRSGIRVTDSENHIILCETNRRQKQQERQQQQKKAFFHGTQVGLEVSGGNTVDFRT